MAEVCRDGGLEDEDMPQSTRKVAGGMWGQVLEDVEARTVYTKRIVWKSTDFLRHVLGETEGRGAITFAYVWWVSTNTKQIAHLAVWRHGERACGFHQHVQRQLEECNNMIIALKKNWQWFQAKRCTKKRWVTT